jgi:multidrug resistance efflux pump
LIEYSPQLGLATNQMWTEPSDHLSEVENETTRQRSFQLKLLAVAGVLFVMAGVAFFSMEFTLHAEGIVQRQDEFIVFAPADGALKSVAIKEGDSVEAGDPLCRFDDREIELNLLEKRQERQLFEFQLASNTLAMNRSEVRPDDRELVNSRERLRLLTGISHIQRESLESYKGLVAQNAISQTQLQERIIENIRVELDLSDAAERVRWLDKGILEIEKEHLRLEDKRLHNAIALLDEEIAIYENLQTSYRLSAPISGRITEINYPYSGMAVTKGAPILKISNPDSPYLIVAKVGEKNFDLIRQGTPVRMESKVFDSMLEGFISGPVTWLEAEGGSVDSVSGRDVSFEIKIEVKATPHPLVLGSGLDVYFMLGKRSFLKTLMGQPQLRRE